MAKSNHNKYVSYPDWFGSSTSQPAQQLLITQTIYYGSGGSSSSSGGTGLTGVVTQGSGNAVTSGTLDGNTLVLNKDLTFVTDQSNTNSFWELRQDINGNSYLYANYDIATLGGHTMYVDGDDTLSLPGLYDGLPIDNTTIYWDADENGNKVLKSMGTGSGGGIADKIAWVNVYDKPGWITNDKPVYNYSEILNIPDLSNFVTITGKQTITGEKNFTGGLKVNDGPIYYNPTDKYWKLEGDLLITGGVSMYSNDSEFVHSTIMDAIVTDEKTISKKNGRLEVIGGIGGGSDTTDIPIATTDTKGIASFDADSFTVTDGAVDLKTKIVISKGTPSSFNSNTLYIIT